MSKVFTLEKTGKMNIHLNYDFYNPRVHIMDCSAEDGIPGSVAISLDQYNSDRVVIFLNEDQVREIRNQLNSQL